MEKARLLSGVKPTGDIHIGNYFGAMKQFVDLQDKYDSFIFIADLHGLNQIHEPEKLSKLIREIASAYLAIGLDPKKVTIFRQSEIAEHSELCWIFNCITSLGALERAHAYKDAKAKGLTINAGLFDYPVLMAADILLYKPDVVPVGADQQQHIEMTVDIVERFNHLFGDTFTTPKGLIMQEAGIIPGLDGRKMSKSYSNVIGLFDPPEVIRRKVASIITDSKRPDEPKDPQNCKVFALHRLFSPNELANLGQRYRTGKIGYKESKDLLAENIIRYLDPIQSRKRELDAHPLIVNQCLAEGREKALPIARVTIKEVKQRVGLLNI
jgi:tryptophanyl-tRNA synthetase